MNSRIFKALGSETRLKIVQTLLLKEHNVTDLTLIAQKDQTTISRHLSTLTNAKVIKQKRIGRNVFYSILDIEMRTWLMNSIKNKKRNNQKDALRSKIENYLVKQEKNE